MVVAVMDLSGSPGAPAGAAGAFLEQMAVQTEAAGWAVAG